MLTQEQLKELLNYNPDTGLFTWKVRLSKCIHVGEAAGSLLPVGYIYITIKNKKYLAHRLAWLYAHGAWPEFTDHINHNKTDNRIKNLRDVTCSGNNQNQIIARTDNKSTGVLGVTTHRKTGKFIASISINGKTKYLGIFTSVEEAKDTYIQAKRKYHLTCTL